MSTTYSLACHQCDVVLCVGQDGYFYDSVDVFKFLQDHRGGGLCVIEFINDLTDHIAHETHRDVSNEYLKD